MSATNNSRRKWLRWVGLSVSLLGVVLAIYLLGAYVDWMYSFVLIIFVPNLVVISSVGTAWKYEFIGGTLLFVEGLFWITIVFLFLHGRFLSTEVYHSLPGFFFIVSGILFLLSWWIKRRTS